MNWLVGGVGGLLVALLIAPAARRSASRAARTRLDKSAHSSSENRPVPAAHRRFAPARAIARRISQTLTRRRLGRSRLTPDSVAAWCDALARRLRSGTTLRESVRLEIPSDRLVADLTNDLRVGIERGHPLTTALASGAGGWAARTVSGIEHLELAASIISSASAMGGSAAAPLDKVGAALRLRSADGQERAAHSAQARLSAHVLTVVPLGILVLLSATDHDVRLVLTTPAGAACVTIGLVLNATGWSWMRRIIGSGH